MKRFFLIYLMCLLAASAVAQQIPTLSQYAFNHYAINPAATGITEDLPLSFAYRKQWAGVTGSPSIQYLSGNMEVLTNMGAGLKLINTQLGPHRKTGLEATYSYHLNLTSEGHRLAFGLSGLFHQFYLNKSGLKVEEQDDQVFMGVEKMIIPDASFGTYFYHSDYFLGIAIPQLFNRNVDLKTDRVLQQKQVRHYYLHGGYRFSATNDIALEPSLLFKFVEAGLLQADINMLMIYNDMLVAGLSWRTADALVVQMGYRRDELTIGYSFDITTNRLRKQSFGSHEIYLGYRLPNFLR